MAEVRPRYGRIVGMCRSYGGVTSVTMIAK
jgi:hypothetical protein